MKRVPPLDPQPTGLVRWRLEHPNDDQSPGTEAGAVWERFKNSGEAYRELLRALIDQQQGLCGYCEQRLTRSDGTLVVGDYQVEHVRPKSRGPGRTLDGTNLLACCGGGTYRHTQDPTRHATPTRDNVSCGQAKDDDELPQSCDPRSFPHAESVVAIGLDGRMHADRDACLRAGIDAEELQNVIDVQLRLNCERLRVAREKVVDELVRWIPDVVGEYLALSRNLSADEKKNTRQMLVGGRLRPDATAGHLCRFWTTERQYLGELAEAWIRDNAASLNFG